MATTIYVPDIECDSCTRLLAKGLDKHQGVTSYAFGKDAVEVELDHEKTNSHDIIKLIQDRGFRASLEPFERKTFKERMHEFREHPQKYHVERIGLQYALAVFLILCAVEFIAYAGFLSRIPGFFGHYGIWLLYLNISVALLGLSIWHVFAYKGKVTCMTGMMIGMTVGMQAGMMIGAIVGATNGFFTGAMVGMLLGVIVGSITGKTCGVMGVMQGMMAGLMGGTMGPMITLMMLSDHLSVFMPFYMAVNILIVLALPYMVFEEVVEDKKVIKQPADFATFATVSFVMTCILVAIMVYGPKAPLFQFG